MLSLTRALGAAALAGLVLTGALLGLPGPIASNVTGAPPATAVVVYAHRGLPDWAEAGYRAASPQQLHGTIQRDRDATGPTFVLVEPDGRRLRIAYANNGDKGLERALRGAHAGGLYSLDGTVLDWGRGVRSFDMGKPLTIALTPTP